MSQQFLSIEDVARITHEANRALCQTLGDQSQPQWDDAPAWQRDSAIKGVTFRLDNPHATPEMMHESWLEQKRAEGWVYGRVKDPDAKMHPCFRPYEELPITQKIKDHLFGGIVEICRPFVQGVQPLAPPSVPNTERAAAVFFDLARDHLPLGVFENVLRWHRHERPHATDYGSKAVASWAQDYVARLLAPAVPHMPAEEGGRLLAKVDQMAAGEDELVAFTDGGVSVTMSKAALNELE